jgi:sulfotransferase
MKEIYFLSGMPRAGNTLLGALINQNKEITVTANSILPEVLYKLSLIQETDIFKNFPDHQSFDNICNNIFNNYYKDWEAKYIIDRSSWGTPGNLELLKKIIKKPKFIILYRPILEALASFIKAEKSKDIEARCKVYMDINEGRHGIIDRYLWSIENILKNKEDHIVIHYKDLINDPIKEIKKIHEFLNIPFKKIELKNFNQFYANNISYDDSVLDHEFHKIRTDKVEQIQFNIEEILPKNIIKKYSGLDVL